MYRWDINIDKGKHLDGFICDTFIVGKFSSNNRLAGEEMKLRYEKKILLSHFTFVKFIKASTSVGVCRAALPRSQNSNWMRTLLVILCQISLFAASASRQERRTGKKKSQAKWNCKNFFYWRLLPHGTSLGEAEKCAITRDIKTFTP